VSHDRAFLDRTVDSLIVLDGKGGAKTFPGAWSDWIASLGNGESGTGNKPDAVSASVVEGPAGSPPPGAKKREARLSWAERRELDGLLDAISALEVEKTQLEGHFSSTSVGGRDRAADTRRHAELESLIAAKTQRWEDLAAKDLG